MTPVEAAQHLADTGFEGWQVAVMTAIAGAESGYDEHAFHLLDSNPESRAYLSVDWGLVQDNDHWLMARPEGGGPSLYEELVAAGVLRDDLPLSQQLLDPAINCKVARAIFEKAGGDEEPWRGYQRWTTWKFDLHMPFMERAIVAAREIGAV